MKLLIVTNIHAPLNENCSNGMERSSYEFILHLNSYLMSNKTELEVHVFTHQDSIIPSPFIKVPNLIHNIDENYLLNGDGISKWNSYSIEKEVLRALTCFRLFDVIHDMSSIFSLPFIASYYHVPYVRTMRLMPYHPVYSLSKDHTSYFILLSDYQKSFFSNNSVNYKIIRDPIVVAYKDKIVPTEKYCICVSRIEERKGLEMSIQLAELLKIKIILIGEVMDQQYFERLSSKYENVTFKGKLNRDSSLELIFGAEYLIWTPLFPEPSGRVVVEALKLGTKVLAFNIGNASDIIDFNDIKPHLMLGENPVYELTSHHLFSTDPRQFVLEHLNIYRTLINGKKR